MSTSKRLGAALATFVLAATGGCAPSATNTPASSTAPSDGLYHLDDHFKNLRFVWTAEPGVELTKGPAVPIRAYFESAELALLVWADPHPISSDLYPGFARAVPPNGKAGQAPDEQLRLWPRGEFDDVDGVNDHAVRVRTWGGASQRHVLSLTPTPGGGWAAVICEGWYSLSARTANDKWAYSLKDFENAFVSYGDPAKVPPNAGWGGITRVEVRQDPSPPNPSSVTPAEGERAQSGPLPAPQVDVFGNWKVTGVLHEYQRATSAWSDNGWPKEEQERESEECMAKAPDPRDVRVKWLVGEHDGPYPYPDPLPAPSPGWPVAREG